ncbi:PEGA domain-containing protein [Erythrobacter sp. GH1-10]|uniref:PEGA domain-containing protein n=1 Tax=Erythrobacter sp. GH1-10 TaxID=3349334 RepID=UPI003877D990
MKKLGSVALAALLASASGGCATVLNGTNVDYSTETRPEGATATFTSGQECITPCELEMKRKNDQRVDLYAEGYKPTYVLIQSKLGGSTFGNILAGGGIGAVVDGSNGASNRLYPRPLIVQLAEEGTDEEAVLLDKDGNVTMTVKEHNDSVRVDVAKTIGAELAGLEAAPNPGSE